ncbi:MAG: hypothetical protein ACKVHL_01245 [Rhodospirillales bacterium]|jgi:hypothetical protein
MKMLGRPILKSVTLAVAISVFLIETAFSTPASNQTANEAAPLRLAALQCPGATDPIEITVEPLFGTINYRMGNTRVDLQRIAGRHAGRSLPGNWYPLGMTQTESIIRAKSEFTIQPLQSGRFCAYPSSVLVSVGYPAFTVWVDRRYRQGSCEYQAILDHEHDHVKIYRDQLRLHIDDIHQRVAEILRRQQPVFATSSGHATERAKRQLFRRILPLNRRLQRAADVTNHQIDTVSSYQAIHDLCQNW